MFDALIREFRHLEHGETLTVSLPKDEDGYPWSSLGWYVAAREHRPHWVGVDRLLGEHGIPKDTAAGRQAFERHMEARRREETDEESLKSLRRGWFLGSEEFKRELMERLEGRLGEHHSGALRLETAEAKAERIIGEELRRLRWAEPDLTGRPKSDPGKLAIAARLRNETTLSIKAIAARVKLGSSKSANAKLHSWMKSHAKSPRGPNYASERQTHQSDAETTQTMG